LESKPLDLEALESKPLDLEALESKPLDLEALESKPLDLEALESKPLDLEALESKPLDLEVLNGIDAFALERGITTNSEFLAKLPIAWINLVVQRVIFLIALLNSV